MVEEGPQRALRWKAVPLPHGGRNPNFRVDDPLPPQAGEGSIQEPAQVFRRLNEIEKSAEMNEELAEILMVVKRQKPIVIPRQSMFPRQTPGIGRGQTPFQVEVEFDLGMKVQPEVRYNSGASQVGLSHPVSSVRRPA